MSETHRRIALHADRPSTLSEDRYHRRLFVRRLTQAVAARVETSPFIIGIEGTWGEGKSTVLEYMAQELAEHHKDVILVRFNPWAYPSQEQMMLGLVRVVAEALEDSKVPSVKDVAAGILHLVGSAAEWAGTATGLGHLKDAGTAGKAVAGALRQEASFSKQKASLERKLNEAGVQVVVLVDDLDRLDHEAIRTVFRLLKAVFDLPSFTYILAYDPAIIASALETHFEARGRPSGRRYLEKIVQLPLALPALDQIDLEEDLFENLTRAFTENDLPPDADELVGVRQLARVLSAHITTPREIRRLGNAVRFALPILRGETNPVDVCRIEAMRVLFPDIFDLVVRHADDLTSPAIATQIVVRKHYERQGGINQLGGALPPKPRSAVYDVFKDVTGPALELLAITFPNVAAEFGRREPDPYSGQFAAAQPEYLRRYVQYAIGSEDVEDAAVQAFIRNTAADEGAADALLRSLDDRRRRRLLSKVKHYARRLDVDERVALMRFLARFLYDQYGPDGLPAVLEEMRSTVVDLLEQHVSGGSTDGRGVVLQRVLEILPAWWMMLDLYRASSSLFIREARSGGAVPAQQSRAWLADVLETHQSELLAEPRAKAVTGLLLLADHRGEALTNSLVLDFVGDRPARAQAWLLTLARQVRGERGPLPSQFGIEQYLELTRVVDMDALLTQLEPLVPHVEGMRFDDAAIARIMLERLQELQPDAQEILTRRAAAGVLRVGKE
ncbi:KAP family P-loop NTPase fold protein [Deinococcus koreensis]|nr:P-loop NTPase fold protein [Deinococcus koreensis]